ncbi:hypothetical protein [Thalassomonas sp. RHCl1]|uniref:hypothetical protein n=1 Tax=Thalassomonas sp. RHCl1 TaxID=2995320 RepID=UPI00248ACA7C|nr:hypothetical protein [Thalassomonas sp. RHCl1]
MKIQVYATPPVFPGNSPCLIHPFYLSAAKFHEANARYHKTPKEHKHINSPFTYAICREKTPEKLNLMMILLSDITAVS